MIVRAYTSADEVVIVLNGEEVGRKAVRPVDKLTAQFDVPYRPGELVAIALRGGQQVGRKTLITVGTPSALRLTAERAVLEASPNDLAYVFAEVCDSQGRRVPDAAVPLTFTLDGAARLRATGSANPRGLKSFSDRNCTTFHGEAGAIVQPANYRELAVLRVSSPGLVGAQLPIRIA